MPTPSTDQSLARRVTLLAIGMIGLVLVLVALTISILTERETRQQVYHTVQDRVDNLVQALDAVEETSRETVVRAFRTFRQSFQPTMRLVESSGELQSFGVAVNNDFGLLDKFSQDTGGVATLFARKGQDFVRVTTSLKNDKGERDLGTLLDRASPAYARALAGQDYTGRVTLFDKPYMTHYSPVKDDSGAVVGIVFVGLDISAFHQNLVKEVQDTHFFDNGGVYVVQPGKTAEEARFVIHPTASGKPVTQVYAQAAPFLQALSQAPQQPLHEGVLPLRGVELDDPWVLMRPTQTHGWWVVAEVSDVQAMASHRKVVWLVWLVLALAVAALGLGLFFLLRRSISHPLQELAHTITLVAQGDLTHPFRSSRTDEIGTLVYEIEGMRQRYLHMLQQVRQAVDSISTASAEIASGNHDLSHRTEQAASSLQQTAQSMEEITATVRQSADAAQHANQMASSAAVVATRGGQAVGEVVSTMHDIHTSSRQIADIVGVIDGIAFQTNILALNAAVEAARAGEQGRGFAVVASEVRSLAGRSAEAAKQIKTLIDTSVQKVESGTRLVQHAGNTMQEIVDAVHRMGDTMGEISSAAGEQSDGIAQVNIAVSQLDQMTQQNASLVQESATAAHSLREQAHRLRDAVQVFKLTEQSSLPALQAPSRA
ncbi:MULTISPECIES: methyl-accepting chemotaxis protein [Giesbergeria]|uniref:Cache 3/Cache 2 fusion domain-containing protein n=1 Tax=Giesbergeria sinuosa TaxID=80883 RepID=A0ABV9QCG0_9BURK